MTKAKVMRGTVKLVFWSALLVFGAVAGSARESAAAVAAECVGYANPLCGYEDSLTCELWAFCSLGPPFGGLPCCVQVAVEREYSYWRGQN